MRASSLALALVIGAASAAVTPARADDFRICLPGTMVFVDDDDCKLRMRVRDSGSTWKIQAEGCFEVSADETDIIDIPRGGWFRAEERRRGRTAHSIEIRRGSSGLERTYERDGKPAPFDAEAREWMESALATVFEHSEFGRDAHIERVLERDGVDAALGEVADLDSDHATRKAYMRILALRPGDPAIVERVVREAERNIDSSHELAEFLVDSAESSVANATTLAAGAAAARAIDSDYERRRALVAILQSPAADATVVEAVLQRANDFDSDHERCELLQEAAAMSSLQARLAAPYCEAVDRMSSDYERARALKSLLGRDELTSESLVAIAAAAGGIDSDYHKAEVLLEMADHKTLDAAARAACVRAARTIDSDHHRGRVLDALQAPES
jgi:hypothetical protein